MSAHVSRAPSAAPYTAARIVLLMGTVAVSAWEMFRELNESTNGPQEIVLTLFHDYSFAMWTWMGAILAFALAVMLSDTVAQFWPRPGLILMAAACAGMTLFVHNARADRVAFRTAYDAQLPTIKAYLADDRVWGCAFLATVASYGWLGTPQQAAGAAERLRAYEDRMTPIELEHCAAITHPHAPS